MNPSQAETFLRAVVAPRQPGNQTIGRRFLRLAAAVGMMSGLLAVCLQVPHVDHATVALLMLLAVYGLAGTWGGGEALAAAIVGGLGFDYFVLPPVGFNISTPEYGVALVAFLAAAFAIIRLTERSRLLLEERSGLLNLSLEPLCIRDGTGDFRLVNPAMEALLGLGEDELRSRSFLEFVHPDDHKTTQAAFLDLPYRRWVDFENRYRTKEGNWRWLRWRIARHSPAESKILAVARDITEEKWAQERLRNLAEQVMSAQEEERRRIAGELHDDITQRLASLGIELGLMKRDVFGTTETDLRGALSGIQEQILRLSDDIRKLSHSLHPSALEHSDLATSLEIHCREFAVRHGIEADFRARDVPGEIPRSVKLALYRIAQESLRNVARHSGAAVVSVVLAGNGESVSLFVIDNGRGFDVSRAKFSAGLGLVSIEERSRQIGASVTIDSMPDTGTRISVRAPLQRTDRTEP